MQSVVETEENCEKPESRYPVGLSRFQPISPDYSPQLCLSTNLPGVKHPHITCEPWSSTAEMVISKAVPHVLGPQRHDMSIRKYNALRMNAIAIISCTSIRYVTAFSFLKSNEPSIPRLMRRNGLQGRIIKLAQKSKRVHKISATVTICTCVG